MSIVIVSPTDTKEAVMAAMGDLASTKPVEETKKASDETPVEKEETEEIEAEEIQDEIEEKEETIEELEAKDEKPKKKGGFQKKIEKLKSEVSNKDLELNFLRQEMARRNTPANETKTEPVDTSKRPKADTFATHDEYVEALTDWKLESKLLVREQKQRDDAIKTEVQTKIGKHQERVIDFAKSHDDWDDALESVDNIPLSITVREAIVSSDIGPELMYELSKDPKELKRICSLNPISAAMALGKIEARISKPSKTSDEPKPKSKVPEPVSPVRTKGGTVAKGYREDMSLREYESWRKESSKRA